MVLKYIIRLILKLFSCGKNPATKIVFLYNKEEILHMFLPVNKKLPVSIEIKDKFGNPAKADGAPSWALSDESLGSLAVAADGMSAEFSPSGSVGSLKLQVKADSDLGDGVKEILGELSLDLLAGEAVLVELKAGEPVDA
jgi:hypothetical protein